MLWNYLEIILCRAEGRQAGCLGIPQNHWTLSTTGFPCFFDPSRLALILFGKTKTDQNPGRIVDGVPLVGLSVEKDQTLDIAGAEYSHKYRIRISAEYSHMAKYLRMDIGQPT